MKVATIAYLPKPGIAGSDTFKRNLEMYPARHDIILFSEHDYGPGVIKIKASPEEVRGIAMANGQPNKFSIHNTIFFTACRIALGHQLTHFLYLETDCRVKGHWDTIIWEEFFNLPNPVIAAGTLSTYNPMAAGRKAALRWEQLVANNSKRNFPISTYGWLGAANAGPSCVFPNGAIAIYDLAWLGRLFNLNDTIPLAVSVTAFDMRLGEVIWEKFREDSYDVLGHMRTLYSGYGDVLTSESERMAWLNDGTFTAIHQCKSAALPT